MQAMDSVLSRRICESGLNLEMNSVLSRRISRPTTKSPSADFTGSEFQKPGCLSHKLQRLKNVADVNHFKLWQTEYTQKSEVVGDIMTNSNVVSAYNETGGCIVMNPRDYINNPKLIHIPNDRYKYVDRNKMGNTCIVQH
ncbi:tRNA (guanine-N(7)-)-methyltransferase [Striga asiatica]|uniref:tRNA (Guanine-N(7)-)-methyltransferase n=1 Tax=Striga asiatica TaxID=4170 RepID=A0A5A7P2Q3_STRAF|nr:tRNA (guanine-N(7)-)-methyltransferase [Striga asiatica]